MTDTMTNDIETRLIRLADNEQTNARMADTIAELHAQIERLQGVVRRNEVQLAAQRVEYADHLERITKRLHDEAYERDFCSEFDDIMEELGLRRRTTDYDVTIEVTLRVTVNVEDVADENDARISALETFDSRHLENYDYDVMAEEIYGVERS